MELAVVPAKGVQFAVTSGGCFREQGERDRGSKGDVAGGNGYRNRRGSDDGNLRISGLINR